MWVWGENNGRVRSWGTLPSLQHFGGRGACWSSGMRLGRMTSNQSLTRTCTIQTTSWLVHNLSTFGVRTSHKQTRTHKIHHVPDLGDATAFPLIIYYLHGHMTITQMAFCPGTPKWESPNSQSWNSHDFGAHNFVCKPLIEMMSEAKL
jgi:hypothetical protein